MTSAPDPSQRYEPIALGGESTVVAEFEPESPTAASYQSEAQLEQEFIELLARQAYEYLPVTSEAGLVSNLRAQLEMLNGITFTDAEWDRFFAERVSSANDGIVEKAARIHEDHIQVLRRDDGTVKNIALLDKHNVQNNRLQVLNQYEVEGTYANRYDVTILVNGLPLVHVELKRRGVDIREAFNQINRYQRDSFWAGSGLFEYVQLFVVSNGTLTKYYSNTTRNQHIAESNGRRRASRKTSNSFEFTSWWADARNRRIADLRSFTKTFFAKHTLLNLLTKYCVFDVDRKLLVMRPYQIVAAEQILRRIETSTNHRQVGTVAAGGYVWHTTGSGKTLTSFKVAQLATRLPHVDKVLFVVDRKDLDWQTMREYERFEKGAANSNTSTAKLKRQLEDPHAKIIITTIQKLTRFVAANRTHEVYGGHVVIIFDECHRSQFGDMHAAITKAFRQYHLFGFTGTPIFAENAPASGDPTRRTTEQAFGDRLHTYTVVDAINDKNVLPFRVDYVNTVKAADAITDAQVAGIDSERALLAPERIEQIADYVLDHFDQKTRRSHRYRLGDHRVSGFNALFATASIDAAKIYYNAFHRRQLERVAADPAYVPLKIALIYSYAPNELDDDGLLAEEEFETEDLDRSSRAFLQDAIDDYNELFGTSFDTTGERFQNYYRDLSLRLKRREVDLAIVVNMFLTGFDATTLNTLWVDKGLRQHGLIQAYSRTNRILNSVKTYGNIVSFRNLEQATNDALALFGNKDARGIVLLKPFADYFAEYERRVRELRQLFPLDQMIVGESAQKDFIRLFGTILRLRNILVSFDDFAGRELLSDREFQDYRSVYLDLHAEFRRLSDAEKESINDDIVFEIELIKQVEVNVDYVLMLVGRYLDRKRKAEDKEVRAEISRAVDSSPTLRNKKDLIERFVDSLTVDARVDAEWQVFVAARRQEELARIIDEERLDADETRAFVERAFRDGAIPNSGTAITRVLPPVSRFSPGDEHGAKKQAVLARLQAFFERFSGLA
jgi:type I restriction enzyme R subunit